MGAIDAVKRRAEHDRTPIEVGRGIAMLGVLGLAGCVAPNANDARAPDDAVERAPAADSCMRASLHPHERAEGRDRNPSEHVATRTIDSAWWGAPPSGGTNGVLLCRVESAPDVEELLRFVRAADPRFRLESARAPSVEARISVGCFVTAGEVFVFLEPLAAIRRDTLYRLVARNESDSSRWNVSEHLGVIAPSE